MNWRGKIQAREKGPKDLVTEADLASQQAIRQLLLEEFPDHEFLGEEQAAGEAAGMPRQKPYRWLVDPLDGTTNFVHQMPGYAVSVALEREGELLVGVVYDPLADECFTAARGCGALLNGQRLAVSSCQQLSQALVAVSFSANVQRTSDEVRRFVEVLVCSRAVRRLGSAALNLSYLAAGRLDAYWASSVKIWDVAAGALLVREAGGQITGLNGQPFQLERPECAAAASQPLHRQLLERLDAAANG